MKLPCLSASFTAPRSLCLAVCLCAASTVPAGTTSAAEPVEEALQRQLTDIGARVKHDQAGRIVAVSNFKPEGKLPAEAWDALAATPTIRSLQGARLTPDDLRKVGRIASLERVNLGGGTFADEDFDSWKNLADLQTLHLHHMRGLDGTFLRHFVDSDSLHHVTIHNFRPFRAAGIPSLARMPQLNSLHLTAVPTKLSDLKPLQGHPGLTEVTIGSDDVDALVDFMATLPKIQSVELFQKKMAPVDEGIVDKLIGMKHLRHIRSVNLGFTQEQHDQLVAAHPGLTIDMRKDDGGHTDSYPVKPF